MILIFKRETTFQVGVGGKIISHVTKKQNALKSAIWFLMKDILSVYHLNVFRSNLKKSKFVFVHTDRGSLQIRSCPYLTLNLFVLNTPVITFLLHFRFDRYVRPEKWEIVGMFGLERKKAWYVRYQKYQIFGMFGLKKYEMEYTDDLCLKPNISTIFTFQN